MRSRLSNSLRLLCARLRRCRVLRPSRAVGEIDVIELFDRSRIRTRGISRKAIDTIPRMRLSWRYSSWVSGCSLRGMSYRPRPRQSTTLLLQLHSFGQARAKDSGERRAHTSITEEKQTVSATRKKKTRCYFYLNFSFSFSVDFSKSLHLYYINGNNNILFVSCLGHCHWKANYYCFTFIVKFLGITF